MSTLVEERLKDPVRIKNEQRLPELMKEYPYRVDMGHYEDHKIKPDELSTYALPHDSYIINTTTGIACLFDTKVGMETFTRTIKPILMAKSAERIVAIRGVK